MPAWLLVQPACSPGVLIARGWSGPACISLHTGLLFSCRCCRSCSTIRTCTNLFVCRPPIQLPGKLMSPVSVGLSSQMSAGQLLSCLLSLLNSICKTCITPLSAGLSSRTSAATVARAEETASPWYAKAQPALLLAAFLPPSNVACFDSGAPGVCRGVTMCEPEARLIDPPRL